MITVKSLVYNYPIQSAYDKMKKVEHGMGDVAEKTETARNIGRLRIRDFIRSQIQIDVFHFLALSEK